jgi:hypothetical protein
MKWFQADSNDSRALRRESLLWLLLLGLCSITLVFLAGQSRQLAAMEQEQDAAQRSTAAMTHELRDKKLELRRDIGRLSTFTEEGLLGQERRLEWIEQLSRVKEARQLINLEYQLGPQRPAPQITAVNLPEGYQVLASPMRLQLQALHEGEFLDFLDDLKAIRSALVRVRHCKVQGADQSGSEDFHLPAIHADCELDWITLGPKVPS